MVEVYTWLMLTIPTDKLTLADIPPPKADEGEIVRFAQTLNGYHEVGGEASDLGVYVKQLEAQPLPQLSLNDVRILLFARQRAHYHQGGRWGDEDPLMDEMRMLTDKIRSRLQGWGESFIRKGYVDCDWGQVHYRIAGKNAGIPLILLHQTASSSAMYRKMMRILADRYWLIAFDTPGFGMSYRPDGFAGIPQLAQSLHQAAAGLGVERATIFGHHTGAAIGVQWAFDQPDFVAKLAMCGPPLLTEGQKKALNAAIQPIIPQADGGHLLKVWRKIAGKATDIPLDLIQRETELTLLAGESYPAAYRAVFDQDFAGQLAALQCPVLAMAGEFDSLRASLDPTMALLHNGQGALVENAGTFICDTHPAQVAGILDDFLQGGR